MSLKGVSKFSLTILPPLSVYSNDTDLTASADDNLDSVKFEMAGGSVYNIEHNGITTQTSRSSHYWVLEKD